MPRKARTVLGPSRLSKILAQLTKPPRLTLAGLKGLKLTLAVRNDHFGARHFVKEELPRIRYANPALQIQVNKVLKSAEDKWTSEMVLELNDGSSKTLDMSGKWSTTIFQELMSIAGGSPWVRWKTERQAKGLPLVEGAEVAELMERRLAEKHRLDLLRPMPVKQENKGVEPEPELDPFMNLRTKTGAAAVLP